ncbi:MAG: glycosyltransferase family 9 protein [Verrucomicrobiota bacterium]
MGDPAVLFCVKLLVYRIGQLGDTLMSLPALWALRKQFAGASFSLLCDQHPGMGYVSAAEVLQPMGIFDRIESYPAGSSRAGRWLRPISMLRLLARLRRQRYDLLAYLVPSRRTPAQVQRDRRFFRMAGIRGFLGMGFPPAAPAKVPGKPLAYLASEADLLLARLSADGIPVPAPGEGCLDLCLGAAEEEDVNSWVGMQVTDGGLPWVGVGPGSKMPAKRWPWERYAEVIEQLIRHFNIWPVVFGDAGDRPLGEELRRRWGRGYNAAGALGVRAAAAALKRCSLLVSNDTGTMHLAAAAGTACVAIFSSRDWPGKWYPYGRGHQVMRAQIECEGCGLVECVERNNECLRRITVPEVVAACERLLSERITHASAEALKC